MHHVHFWISVFCSFQFMFNGFFWLPGFTVSVWLKKRKHFVYWCQCDLQSRVWSDPKRWNDDDDDDNVQMGWTALLFIYLLCVGVVRNSWSGRRWSYLRSIFPSHWSFNRSCSDALPWHSQVSGDKKKSDEPGRRNTSVGGRSASFQLMVDAPLRVLTRLEVGVLLR